jgi:catechol 2,3-dioxygenase-like lactoylglutathione lyase family enzyme
MVRRSCLGYTSSRESEAIFTGAVAVLPTTDLNRATSFYRQLGFQVLHQEAEYAIVTRGGVELHLWLCPDRTLAEKSSCRIQVTGLEALSQEYQTKGLLAPDAAARATPWGTRELVVFDPDRVLITFVERMSSA